MGEHQQRRDLSSIVIGARPASALPTGNPQNSPVADPRAADPRAAMEQPMTAAPASDDAWAQAKARRDANRTPFGELGQKLAYTKRPGYHRHWANDTPDRLASLQDRGYMFVQGKDGKHVSKHVGVTMAGQALTAYLMEIPEEWHQEDVRQEQSKVDAIDDALNRGAIAGEPGKDGRYVPQTGIKIERR